jgi:putative PIN family toxin of toxin-antitoxin system
MLRVTADTNIYISALNFGGKPLAILDAAQHGEIELAISEPIMAEMIRILRNKFQWPEADLAEIGEQILAYTLFVEPRMQVTIIDEDPSDNRILECARESSSGYIVSGDAHLLKLVEFEGAKIVTPSQFLSEHLRVRP